MSWIIIACIAAGTSLLTVLLILSLEWLKKTINKRKLENKNHKVVFLDTKEIIDEAVKEELNGATSISMDDLEKLKEESPYLMVDMDKTNDELSNFEKIKPKEVSKDVQNLLNEYDGALIIN